MKIGVSTYSFNKLLRHGGFDLFDAIERAAKIGFDCVEVTDLEPPAGETTEDYAKRVKECAEKAGIPVSSYITYADFVNGKDGDGDTAKEIARVKGNVDIAALLGATELRHDTTWGFKDKSKRTYQDAIKIIAPAIREVTEYAAPRGIKTMSENHGYFMQDSCRMEALVKAVDHPNYGLLVDIGNFMCADEDCARAVAAVAPYAFHVHAKDFLYKPGIRENPGEGWFPTRSGNYLRGTALGHGVVPVKQCLKLIESSGFDGVVALEFEGLEDTLTAVELGYKLLRSIFG